MEEIWRVIFVDYLVSNFGNVDSWKGCKRHRLKPKISSKGYLYVTLMVDGKPKNFFVHRLVAIAFLPNLNNLPQVNHKDGNKLNNCVENLEWFTPKDNQQHAIATGLSKTGEERSQAKLTNEQVRYIRENPNNSSQYELAKKFEIDQTTISLIQLGKIYKKAGGIIREKSPKKPKVPDEKRAEIKRRYEAGGVSQSALAKEFGYHQTTISNIIRENH